jgi:hypothetical protein
MGCNVDVPAPEHDQQHEDQHQDVSVGQHRARGQQLQPQSREENNSKAAGTVLITADRRAATVYDLIGVERQFLV